MDLTLNQIPECKPILCYLEFNLFSKFIADFSMIASHTNDHKKIHPEKEKHKKYGIREKIENVYKGYFRTTKKF